MAKVGRPRKERNKIYLKDQDKVIDIPRKAADLIDVLRAPESVGLTVTEICARAGIDRATYYSYFRRSDVAAVIKQECYGMITSKLLPVINSILARSVDPEMTSHHWARMVMQMGKMIDVEKESAPTQINFVINFERPKIEEAIDITNRAERAAIE